MKYQKKISTVVTDNASNMNKAFDFTLPGYLPEETTNENEDSFDSDYSDIEDSKEDDTPDGTNDESYECLPRHISCYAHTLQLFVKDWIE